MEAECLPRFDRVFLANDADRADLARRFGSDERFVHVANALPLPTAMVTPPRPMAAGDPLRVLFVGTLNYFPNEDGLGFFCDHVLPVLRARAAPRQVRLVIAGARPSPRVQAMAAAEGVVIISDVPDLGPVYRDADVVIAPIRAGGGTRIKVLEAFAHRRPLVATSAAVEGVDVRDGEHLLIADTPAAFATACLRLTNQPQLAAALTERAYELAHATHGPSDIAGLIQAVALQACRLHR
jgi:glycosyltransferase involved in cell wall biosynthesis